MKILFYVFDRFFYVKIPRLYHEIWCTLYFTFSLPFLPLHACFPLALHRSFFFSLRVLFHLFLFLLLLFLFINVLTKHSKTRRRYRRTEEKQLIRIIRSLVTDSVSLQFFFLFPPRKWLCIQSPLPVHQIE